MHPLLRTLDLSPQETAESSALELNPIHQAAVAGSRKIPILSTLGLTPLLIYGLSISIASPSSKAFLPTAVVQSSHSITFLLQEPAATFGSKVPFQSPPGLGSPGDATSYSDPMPTPSQSAIQPAHTEALDLETLSLPSKTEQVDLSLSPALVIQSGAHGLGYGTGTDKNAATRGSNRPQDYVPVRDLLLVPIRQVPVHHRLLRGEESAARQPVRIRLLIGDNGVPFQATVVSGPSFLVDEALKAARQWRFEPLGPHGLQAPQSVTLKFFPLLER